MEPQFPVKNDDFICGVVEGKLNAFDYYEQQVK